MALISTLLGVIFILLLPTLYRFYTFVYVHFLHKSTVTRYLYGPEPYCLITGASDGIGKAFAFELYKLGFNVIIHGRNKAKLEGVRTQLLESTARKGKVVCLVADAATLDCDLDKIGRELEGLDITLLLNNIGGADDMRRETMDHQSFASVLKTVHLNALFPLRLTQLLLPRLRALPGPALVISVGSIAGEVCPPYLGAYASSKTFLATLVRSLDFDERAFVHSNVEFMYLQTGAVVSSNGVTKKAWHTPYAADYARAAIQKIGCGQRVVCGYAVHAFLRWALQAFGERIGERAMMASVKSMTTFDEHKTE